MSRTKKHAKKGTVEGATQQAPGKDSCQGTFLPAPTKVNKIALGISLTLLLAWIGFLAFLAMSK